MTFLIGVGPHPKLDAIESYVFHRTPAGWKPQVDDRTVDRDLTLLRGGASLAQAPKP